MQVVALNTLDQEQLFRRCWRRSSKFLTAAERRDKGRRVLGGKGPRKASEAVPTVYRALATCWARGVRPDTLRAAKGLLLRKRKLRHGAVRWPAPRHAGGLARSLHRLLQSRLTPALRTSLEVWDPEHLQWGFWGALGPEADRTSPPGFQNLLGFGMVHAG